MKTACVLLIAGVATCTTVGLSAQSRSFTFGGAARDSENISAVLLVRDRVLLVDDELRGVLVGNDKGSEYAFTLETLPLPPEVKPSKDEFDLEGLALAGADIFAVGSHAAVRTSADDPTRTWKANRDRQLKVGARPDREWLFKFRLSADGKPVETIAVSLSPLLSSNPLLSPFLRIPSKENGIDIEGLAVDRDTLFIGFRGPVLRHGFVPVLKASGFPKLQGEVVLLALGGRGIRDMAKVAEGLLVLGGPVGDSDQDHRLYLWNGADCIPSKDVTPCVIRELAVVQNSKAGKAEGIFVLKEDPTYYELLVVFDGIKGGGPVTMRVQK